MLLSLSLMHSPIPKLRLAFTRLLVILATGLLVALIGCDQQMTEEQPENEEPVKTGPLALVTNSESNNVSVIDVNDRSVVDTIPVGDGPKGVAITPDGRHAFVANSHCTGLCFGASVSVINVPGRQVVDELAWRRAQSSVAITPDGEKAVIGGPSIDRISVVDTAVPTRIADVDLNLARITDLAITPDGEFALTPTLNFGDVRVFGIADREVVSTIDVGDKPRGVTITPDGGHAFVANTESNNVSVIDIADRSVLDTIEGGSGPEGIVITPDGQTALVTNTGSNTLSVIDVANREVDNTIEVGDGPKGIAITPNGELALVANFYGQTVSVVDIEKREEVDVISRGLGNLPHPHGIAITKRPETQD